MSAIAGIDQALWDIKGKALGVPVYELLGGKVRDRMKVYSWVGGDRPGDIVRATSQRRMAGGFDTFKLNGSEEMAMLDTPRAVDGRGRASWPRCTSTRHRTSASTSTAASRRRWPSRCSRRWSRSGRCSSRSRCWPSRPSTTRAWPQCTSIPLAAGERHVLALRVQARARGRRHRHPAARPVARRRHHRVPQDRRHGRGLRRGARAALPARPAWRSRPACRSRPRAPTTPCCRSRAWASTTTSATTSSTT